MLAVGLVPAVALADQAPAPAEGASLELLANATSDDLFNAGEISAVKYAAATGAKAPASDAAATIVVPTGETTGIVSVPATAKSKIVYPTEVTLSDGTKASLLNKKKDAIGDFEITYLPTKKAVADAANSAQTSVTSTDATDGTQTIVYLDAKAAAALADATSEKWGQTGELGASDKVAGWYMLSGTVYRPYDFSEGYWVQVAGKTGKTYTENAKQSIFVNIENPSFEGAYLYTTASTDTTAATEAVYSGTMPAGLAVAIKDADGTVKDLALNSNYTVKSVKRDGTTLTAALASVVAPGTYTIVLTGVTYEGDVTLQFTIKPVALADAKIVLADTSKATTAVETGTSHYLDLVTSKTPVVCTVDGTGVSGINTLFDVTFVSNPDGTAATDSTANGVYTYKVTAAENAGAYVTGEGTATYTQVGAKVATTAADFFYDADANGSDAAGTYETAWSSIVKTYNLETITKDTGYFDVTRLGYRAVNSAADNGVYQYTPAGATEAVDVPFTVKVEKVAEDADGNEVKTEVLSWKSTEAAPANAKLNEVGKYRITASVNAEDTGYQLGADAKSFDIDVYNANLGTGLGAVTPKEVVKLDGKVIANDGSDANSQVVWDGSDWLAKLAVTVNYTLTVDGKPVNKSLKQDDLTLKVEDAKGNAVESAAEVGEYTVTASNDDYNYSAQVAKIVVGKVEPQGYRIVSDDIEWDAANVTATIKATSEPIELSLVYATDSAIALTGTSASKWTDLGDLVTVKEIKYSSADGSVTNKTVEEIKDPGTYTVKLVANEDAELAGNFDLSTILASGTAYDFTSDTTGYAAVDTFEIDVIAPVASKVRVANDMLSVTDSGQGYIAATGEAIDLALEYTDVASPDASTEWTVVPAGAFKMTITKDGAEVEEIKEAGVYTVKLAKGDGSLDVSAIKGARTYDYGATTTDISGTDVGTTNASIKIEVVDTSASEDGQPVVTTNTGGTYTFADGVVTIIPDEGYQVVAVSVDGTVVTPVNNQVAAKANNRVDITFGKVADEPTPADPTDDPKEDTSNYTDIDNPSDWWNANGTQEVQTAIENGWMEGVNVGGGKYAFQPSKLMTRGSVAETIYKMAGEPEVAGYDAAFSDVSLVASYADAVQWCYDTGVITGYDDGTFRPTNNVTREQFITMLSRYAQATGVSATGAASALAAYTDAASVHSYATATMAWAVEDGLAGVNTTKLNPLGNITRAQGAAMCVRYADKHMA